MTDKIKFGTGHFPVGTICEVNVAHAEGMPKIVEVKRVGFNGPSSIVIETTTYN